MLSSVEYSEDLKSLLCGGPGSGRHKEVGAYQSRHLDHKGVKIQGEPNERKKILKALDYIKPGKLPKGISIGRIIGSDVKKSYAHVSHDDYNHIALHGAVFKKSIEELATILVHEAVHVVQGRNGDLARKSSKALEKEAYNTAVKFADAHATDLKLTDGQREKFAKAANNHDDVYTEIKDMKGGGPGSGRHAIMLTRAKVGGYRLDHWLNNQIGVRVVAIEQQMLDPKTLHRIQDWTREEKIVNWQDANVKVSDMPPVDVVRTTSGDYLFDGTHRTELATRQGESIPANVYTIKTRDDVTAGGQGSGRKKTVDDIVKILQKKWKNQTEEDPRQQKLFAGGPGSGRHKAFNEDGSVNTTIKKDPEHQFNGNWHVYIGNHHHVIYRDPESTNWYEAQETSGKGWMESLLSVTTKKDAVQALVIRHIRNGDLQAAGTQSEWKLQGHTIYQGLKIAIENKKGSVRSGKEPSGKPWSIKMPFDYGYIKSTEGKDGDEVDCFLGPDKDATHVFIIHQHQNGKDKYDEDKCMLGWDSADAAKKAYHSAYNNVDLFTSMTMMSIDEFKDKLKTLQGKKINAAAIAEIDKLQAGGPGSGRHKDSSYLTRKSPTGFSDLDRRKGFSINEKKLAELTEKLAKKNYIYQKTTVDSGGGKNHYYVRKSDSKRATLLEPSGNQLARGKFNRIIFHDEIKAGGPGSGRHPYGRKIDFVDKEKKLAERRVKERTARQALNDQGLSQRGKPIVSEKAKRALATMNVAKKAEQDIAEKTEQKVTKALGGKKSGDNSPFDVTMRIGRRAFGVEVKALLNQRNDKITQKGSAIDRKLDHASKNGIATNRIWTIGVDYREPDGRGGFAPTKSKPDIYIRQGVGSFRLGSMIKVERGLKGLKDYIQ